MKTLIYIGGFYCVAFAVFHLAFWRLFDWERELAKLNVINRNVMQILNLCLTFVFGAFAYISFTHGAELPATKLGRTLLLVIAFFWLLRAIEQVVFFGLKRKISAGFFAAFLTGAVIFALPLL